MASSRSAGFFILALLIVGAVCAYTLPPFSGEGDVNDLNSMVALLMIFTDKAWLFDLARAGVLVAAVSAIAFPASQRVLRAVIVTAGVVATLPFMYLIVSLLGQDGSLGPGLIGAELAFLAAAIVSWMAAGKRSDAVATPVRSG